MIPSMGGNEIGNELKLWASEVPESTCIVEVGVWLGAGTEKLALGIAKKNNVKIHCYDRFVANESEVKKARGKNIILKKGVNTLPLVCDMLGNLTKNIYFHKGDIKKALWNKKPISMYIDDMCKRKDKFLFAMKTFSPYFITGAIIVLMDYFWSLKHKKEKDAQIQPEFIEKNKTCFELIKTWDNLSCAAFKYNGGKLKI